MVERHQFSRTQVSNWISSANKMDSIVTAMQRPAEKVKPWFEYREHFISNLRISRGVEFWAKYSSDLDRAQTTLGVDAAVIVSIIGVETNYGRTLGNYRVIDALGTLAFDYYTKIEPREKRRLFFTRELENLMLLAREQNQDPLALMGSYAGAMGWGQFMPSSYRNYAIDFDQDGSTDIWNNPTDVIGSVANYLAKHGWEAGQPVALEAQKIELPNEAEDPESLSHYIVNTGDTLHSIARKHSMNYRELLRINDLKNPDLLRIGQRLKVKIDSKINKLSRPSVTLDQLRNRGIITVKPADELTKALPLKLDAGGKYEYWMGLKNFYVISRYNPRIKYAMAVYQLSELIRNEYCATQPRC